MSCHITPQKEGEGGGEDVAEEEVELFPANSAGGSSSSSSSSSSGGGGSGYGGYGYGVEREEESRRSREMARRLAGLRARLSEGTRVFINTHDAEVGTSFHDPLTLCCNIYPLTCPLSSSTSMMQR